MGARPYRLMAWVPVALMKGWRSSDQAPATRGPLLALTGAVPEPARPLLSTTDPKVSDNLSYCS